MSDVSQGPGWWLASDGKWYPPHTAPQAAVQSEHDVPPATSQFQPAPGAAPGYGTPAGAWQGGPGGHGTGVGSGTGPAGGTSVQTASSVASQSHLSTARRHWQPWLALVGVALVLWGAGQGLLAWSEWRLIQTEFSPYGTVTPGHLGMVLTAAGILVTGLATVAIALTLDRR